MKYTPTVRPSLDTVPCVPAVFLALHVEPLFARPSFRRAHHMLPQPCAAITVIPQPVGLSVQQRRA